jgi:ribonuclease HI
LKLASTKSGPSSRCSPRRQKRGAKVDRPYSSLEQFIAKLAERSLHFFSILRGSTKVEWGPVQ